MKLTAPQYQRLPQFIGREAESARLLELANTNKAQIVVVYGRRRVGKTELIEHTLGERNLLKFEGLERQSKAKQIEQVMTTLARYTQEPTVAKIKFKNWVEVFEFIAQLIKTGRWTLYLEELQWLANYHQELISAFKYVWDNALRHNASLLVVFCGSSPSFMINKVLFSSALYNRSEESFPLYPLPVSAARKFFSNGSSPFEIMDALLTVGAIPPYLEKLAAAPSVQLGLCKHAFQKNSYFVEEYERIFTSSMSENPAYKKILEFLAGRPYATRKEIAKAAGISSGGGLAAMLLDLEQTNFIQSYSPLEKKPEAKNKRYQLIDPYLQFFLQFIKPKISKIRRGLYDAHPERTLDLPSWRAFLGLSFERWIRNNALMIAEMLGFRGIDFNWGAYFSKKEPKVQIDLIFERADKVTTIVEVKYTQSLIGKEVIKEFERKCAIYPAKNQSIKKVLISASGATEDLKRAAYFDKIITLEEIWHFMEKERLY
jgi:AAA+ ATPase superfamily predicted ATPase